MATTRRAKDESLGTLLACAEMIRGGVTCFADMYYFEDAVAQAAADLTDDHQGRRDRRRKSKYPRSIT
jgi:cytosine/adenosine deaminase-related metal-dependent hydrolase